MPDPPAIRLDADLEEARVGLLANGLEAERGRVGVCADHGDGVSGFPFCADGEGDDGGAVAS
jgi:hypothetical protein